MKEMVLDSNKVALLKEYAEVSGCTTDRIFLAMTEHPVQFSEITELDVPTIARIGEHYNLEVQYAHLTVTSPEKYVADCLVYIDGLLYDGFTTRFTAEEDFLGLFTQEVKEVTEEKELTVKELFSKSASEIIDYLKDNNFTVWDSIKSMIFDDMDADDVPGNIESDIVDRYLESESVDAMERAMKYADSEDVRDIAKEIIDEL